MKLPIYMDSHATTPVDPRVLSKMLPYFTEHFGNAASRNHMFGWKVEEAVDEARKQVAALINADPKEIIFTSGATESDNLALTGAARMYEEKGNHIITSPTEHNAILDTCKRLRLRGFEVTYLPVDKYGLVDPNDVRKAITDKTILVSIMTANNEIGTIAPIREIGEITREKGVLFHSDAVQAAGKIPLDVDEMNLDLVSLTAHKMYGPKGIGALYIRRKDPRVKLSPIIHGGGHERGMRSGTLNIPGIVGFGEACEICRTEMADESLWVKALRDRLQNIIMSGLDEVYLNGHPEKRLPQNLNIAVAYVEGESLIMGLEDIAVSSGSACTSATLEPSQVLSAIGLTQDLAHTSVRFGLHRFTTDEEVEYVGNKVVETVNRLRELSPLYEMAKEGVDIKSFTWVND
ncbi:IscS subfamily cysteine desulfurase [candidate division KSB1 bacterium]